VTALWMERMPIKVLPWIPTLLCEGCEQPVDLEAGVVLWKTAEAECGTLRGFAIACGPVCEQAMRVGNLKSAPLGCMPIDEWLALLLFSPERRERIAQAADRISRRGQVQETIVQVRARRNAS
jgi:hypothetical protein